MSASALEMARINMIEQQIRPCDIVDPNVLQVLRTIPREQFVPAAYQNLAFADTDIPLVDDNVMLKPLQAALLLQALRVQNGERVLEIGTGSGFVTACLLALGGSVVSYEINPTLAAQAMTTLQALNQANQAKLITGDIFQAEFAAESFDVIAVTGSLPLSAKPWFPWLAPGGRLFYIEGQDPVMQTKCITHTISGACHTEILGETLVPPLQGAPQYPAFVF